MNTKTASKTRHSVQIQTGERRPTKCGKCGTTGLYWHPTGNGYRLFEMHAGVGAVKHICYSRFGGSGAIAGDRKRAREEAAGGRCQYTVTAQFGGREYVEDLTAMTPQDAVFEVAALLADRFNRKDSIDTIDGVRKTKWTPESVYLIISKTSVTKLTADHIDNIDPDYGHDTITREQLIELAREIVPTVVSQFYPSNRTVYQRLQFDPEDIEQYLYEKVLMSKYIGIIERRPRFYRSIKNLRRALYVACKYACLAHYRMHVQSICRGSILNCQVLELDSEGASLVSLAGEVGSEHMDRLRVMIDTCPSLVAQRMLFFIGYEDFDSKAALRKRFPITHDEFDEAWKQMEDHVERWRDQIVPQAQPAVHHVHGGRRESVDPELTPFTCRTHDEATSSGASVR
jgi:hypothetical protein